MTDEMTRAQWRALLRLFRRFVEESGIAPETVDPLVAEMESMEAAA